MNAIAPETRGCETEADYPARLAALALERDEMKARAERAEHDRDQFKKLYLLVALELERLKRQLFGQKAEMVDPAQVQLAFAPVLKALERAEGGGQEASEEVESELSKLRKRAQAEVDRRKAEKKKPKPHGRRDVSLENLPVETITLEPPERLVPGGDALVWIGDEVSEQIDRRPASLIRVRVVRRKYKVAEAAPAADEGQPSRATEMADTETSVAGADGSKAGTTTAAPGAAAEGAKPEAAVMPSGKATPAAAFPEAPVVDDLGEGPDATNVPAPAPTERDMKTSEAETTPLPAAPQEIKLPKPGTILIAPMPDRPIPRSIAGPGLLAHVLVSKYGDHIPLHRQEMIYRREGVHLPRSTLCGFVQGSVELLKRIVDAMWEDAKANARWICIDATGVLVFAKEKCRHSHFWVMVAERHHVLFRYTKNHDGSVPAELLKGYRGYLLADASSVYHELYRREPGIIECACWAHSRRMAFEALSSDEPRALVIIGFIRLLYDAHLLATDPKTRVTDGAKRKVEAQPVIDKLYSWIKAERPKVADDAPIAKAMNYLVNHRVPLTRFLDDGTLRLDNNLSELELRRQKVGAKNWLFCGSDDGAHWNATAVSLIASCQLHGIEPWAYLRDVLTLLPAWSAKQVLALAPKYWNETRQKPETQQLLGSLRLLGRNDPSHAPETTPAK